MNALALPLLTLAACSSSGDERSWSCTEIVCFPTTDACGQFVAESGTTSRCEPKAVAYCAHGCRPNPPAGSYPSCGASCATSLDSCQVLGVGACQKEPPPDLFAPDSTPGFWCFEYQAGPDRPAVSWCTKYREECDYLIDDTLGNRARRSAARSGDCRRACQRATSAYCWTRLVQGVHVPLCTATASLCMATRAVATAAATSECRLAF